MTSTPRPATIRVPALALAMMLALLIPAAAGAGHAGKVVAKQAESEGLGKTILTNNRGRTLYSLSAETKGRFICTSGCLSIWRPLVIRAGVRPKGPVKLGTIKRPDGRTQVTYKGRPLYSFGGDTKAGDVSGEGIKDVGTWHAAATGMLTPEPQSEPPPPPQPEPQPSPHPSPYPYPY